MDNKLKEIKARHENVSVFAENPQAYCDGLDWWEDLEETHKDRAELIRMVEESESKIYGLSIVIRVKDREIKDLEARVAELEAQVERVKAIKPFFSREDNAYAVYYDELEAAIKGDE